MMQRLAQMRPAWVLAAIVIVSTTATVLAMRRTSTTFDEIVLIAAGARGYETGKFELAPDHPPMMQYIYGLPVYLSKPNYPSDAGFNTAQLGYRYLQAQNFFWNSGNNPERLAFLGRLPAAIIALLLVLATFAFTRRVAGSGAALIAAALVAFLPDILAHGGVSYNDVPLTLTYFLAVWAVDRVVREPDWRNALMAGAAVGLAFGVKISAIALGPVVFALLALEAIGRGLDMPWLKRIVPATLIGLAAAYLMLVIIYRGDFALEQFQYALDKTFRHVSKGHGAAGFLRGEASRDGFWYFFPVAFLYKTSAALHLLAVIALGALLKADYPPIRQLAAHPLRVPVLAAAFFSAALLTSSLNIGFRYAMPVLPHICVLIAVGVAYMWRISANRIRALIAVLIAWVILAPLSYYPNFLSYISEYGPGRDRGSEILVDSSLDWGQGLLQLREYMNEHRIERIYLSYFGSAWPDGYGIDYVPMHSFFPLLPSRLSKRAGPKPTHIVISGTNLRGVYFNNDPFARFRDLEPDAVIAHSMYVYRIRP